MSCFQRSAKADGHAVACEPVGVVAVVGRLRAGRADIAQIGAELDEQAADQQFGAS